MAHRLRERREERNSRGGGGGVEAAAAILESSLETGRDAFHDLTEQNHAISWNKKLITTGIKFGVT